MKGIYKSVHYVDYVRSAKERYGWTDEQCRAAFDTFQQVSSVINRNATKALEARRIARRKLEI